MNSVEKSRLEAQTQNIYGELSSSLEQLTNVLEDYRSKEEDKSNSLIENMRDSMQMHNILDSIDSLEIALGSVSELQDELDNIIANLGLDMDARHSIGSGRKP